MISVIVAMCQAIWYQLASQWELSRMDPVKREELLAETGGFYNGLPVE